MAEHSFGTSCAPKFGRWLRANAAKLFGMDLPIVSMDESGNTGQNLLDPDQPVFALASISLTDEEARQIVGQSAEELHFAKMRKSRVGRQRVLDVLGALDPERAKVVPIHKRFMVTAKIVDQLVEPQARAVGHDGIADGSMLALANLWHLTSGTFCGEDKFERLLRAFVDCVRLRELEAADEFYAAVEDMVRSDPGTDLELLMYSERQMAVILAEDRQQILEPGLATVQSLIYEWAPELPGGFRVRHDNRPSAQGWVEYIRPYFDQSKPTETFTFARGRQITLPLPVEDFELRASHEHPAIQIADILASATTQTLKSRALGTEPDKFAVELEQAGLFGFVVDQVWPDPSIFDRAPVPGAPGEFDRMVNWL